jgi:hypothetical protein
MRLAGSVVVGVVCAVVAMPSSGRAATPSRSDVLVALQAFPEVPMSIATTCEVEVERGTFKLMKCAAIEGNYSFDANGVMNYMQVIAVPGVSSEKACRAIVESIAKDVRPNGSKREGSSLRMFFYRGEIAYKASWADSKATGKMCTVWACNTSAGPNVFGIQNACAKG